MSKIKEVSAKANFPEMEDRILEFWKENDTFQKSIDSRPADNRYSFVDGPPFVSGMPHPAHLFVSVAKDLIPRYWTMKGKRVRRVFGWDCHGLPIEAKVNQRYNLTGRKQIEEEFGVDRYIKECRSYVEEFSDNWRWYIEKVGRWADMDGAYYTMKPEFNESVIWAFKQAWDKGYIYKGKRVSLYSTDTATPVSNFEVAMDADNYQDTVDISVFVKFELEQALEDAETDGKPAHMLAWTTTPWTIPANFALAVHSDYEYCLVEFNEEYYVVNTQRLEYTFSTTEENIGEDHGRTVRIVKRYKGTDLVGLRYKPVYDFFKDEASENDHQVYTLDEVSNEEGTGVLHIAPAFGEVDFNFGQEKSLSMLSDIDDEGFMTVGPWKGTYLRDASPLIAEDMAERNILFRSENYNHRLPYYRGDNPLIYMAQDAYFMDVQKMKDRMLELNQDVNWVPEHFKEGRFAHVVATAPDWNISRSRYWATVMPLWVSEDGDQLVVGSIKELMEYTDQIVEEEVDEKPSYTVDGEPFTFHRDICDKLVLTKDGKEYRRVPEVLDCWMDSGSVPFAEYHYPFENQEEFRNAFPADFIVEYAGQVRAWFNVLFRMSVLAFDELPYKNVICHGVMSGNDGRKMSKTYGNYTDPDVILKNIGGEAFRLYAMGSPLMGGGDMDWSDEDLNEYVKTILIPFWNTYRYLTMYANLHSWSPENTDFPANSALDRWIKSVLHKAGKEYSEALERYDIPGSVKLIQPTIDQLSKWWIRRSRDRFAAGDPEALQTLYASVVYLSKIFAPQLPFLMEDVYQNLVVGTGIDGAYESVHLEYYPEEFEIDSELLTEMEHVQLICSLGLNIRDDERVKLRQPLSKAYVSSMSEEMKSIVQSELNVKEVLDISDLDDDIRKSLSVREEDGVEVAMGVEISDELAEEGLLNEVVRKLQAQRKNSGLQVGDRVFISYATQSDKLDKLFTKYTDELLSRVNASGFTQAEFNDEEGVKTFMVNDEEMQVLLVK